MPLPLKPGESPEAQAYAAQSVEEAEFQIMMCLAAGNHEAARRALKAFGDLRGEEERAKALEEGAKERNDLRSKLEGMARSRDKWQTKYESFTQAAGMKPLRVAYLALVEAVRSALHTLQDPMRGFSRRCASDLPHDHKDLQAVRAAMSLLNAAHDAAVEVVQPRSLAAAPSGDAAVSPDRCRSTYKAAVEVERVCTLEFGHIGAHATFPAPSGDAKGTK